MKVSQINDLICPYSGEHFSKFEIQEFDVKTGSIIFGILISSHEEYPIIGGILYNKREHLRELVSLVKQKNFTTALLLALTHRKVPLLTAVEKKFKLYPLVDHFITNTSVSTFLLRLLLGRSVTDYYLSRFRWKDSLQFFTPLLFKKSSEQVSWLDIGAGIHTHYACIEHGLTRPLVSIDKDFINLFYSARLFPADKCLRICLDVKDGICTKKKFDIITCNDSLQYIKNPRLLLSMIKSKLASGGILFCSNIPEKLYYNQDTLYPIKRSTIVSMLHNSVIFFSSQKLAKQLATIHSSNIQRAIIGLSEQVFKYSFVFRKNTRHNLRMQRIKDIIPENVLKRAVNSL